MNVTIYEPGYRGHRLHYVSLMVSAIAKLGLRPTLVTSKAAMASQDFEGHLGSCRGDLDLYEIPDKAASTAKSLREIRDQLAFYNEASQRLQPDHILIPTGEQILKSLIWQQSFTFGRAKTRPFTEALFFSPGYGYRFKMSKRRFSNPILKRVSRNLPLDTYAHADPFQLASIAVPDSRTRYTVMPDPVPTPIQIDKPSARRRLGIPVDGRYIAICGGISKSKGVHDLVNAFASASKSLAATDRLLLAGPFDSDTRSLIFDENRQLIREERLIAIDRSLFGEDFDLTFAAIDLFCAVQRGRPGSSSTLLRAATAGVPILARDQYWSGRIVREFGLGWVSKSWNHSLFCQSLVQCMEKLAEFEQRSLARKYLEFHKVANFQATWTSRLRERMGIGPDSNQIHWDSLNENASFHQPKVAR